MRKLLLFVLVPACLLALASCSENFDVAAPYKNVTLVYGFLNMDDTAHYIRIEKTFLDQSKSAIDMAQIPDSSYYPQLNVVVKELNPLIHNNVVSTTPLSRVDMAGEGYPKDAPSATNGFFVTPSYAYKYKKALNPVYIYRLVVTNTVTGVTDSAQTGIINTDVTAFKLNPFDNPSSDGQISFARTGRGDNFTVTISPAPPNAYIYEGIIRFRYVDHDIVANTRANKSIDWPFASTTSNAAAILTVNNADIYSFLANSMGPAPTSVERLLDTCTIYVYAGDTALNNYESINVELKNGLTANEIKPNYTNIIGLNALGLLGTRAMRMHNITIDNLTLGSLDTNQVTRPLNITGYAY